MDRIYDLLELTVGQLFLIRFMTRLVKSYCDRRLRKLTELLLVAR